MFWIDAFWCTQFIVIYKRFFNNILEEPFGEMDAADLKLSEMTSHKMVMFPFISIQKDFGYSDATPVNNNDQGMITRYFKDTSDRLESYYCAGEKFKQSLK